MAVKWIGAALVMTACGSIGFLLASMYRRQEGELGQLIQILEYMSCELTYRLTPLPELCLKAGGQAHGQIKDVFLTLSKIMEERVAPDGDQCMEEALEKYPQLLWKTRQALSSLGLSLGHFDLEGQLKGLDTAVSFCKHEQEAMRVNKTERLRTYQTMGLCAGAALVILLI